METVSYEDFALGISQRISGKRIPLRGTIEVTRRCPLTCVHCYNNLPLTDQQTLDGELSYEEHCRILDEIVELTNYDRNYATDLLRNDGKHGVITNSKVHSTDQVGSRSGAAPKLYQSTRYTYAHLPGAPETVLSYEKFLVCVLIPYQII